MLQNWSESSTWNSLSNGVSLDGVEATSSPLTTIDAGVSGWIQIDVTTYMQTVANGGNNYGWVFATTPGNADNWGFASSEHSNTRFDRILVLTIQLHQLVFQTSTAT